MQVKLFALGLLSQTTFGLANYFCLKFHFIRFEFLLEKATFHFFKIKVSSEAEFVIHSSLS